MSRAVAGRVRPGSGINPAFTARASTAATPSIAASSSATKRGARMALAKTSAKRVVR